MPCSSATCLHGQCKAGSCVCNPGFLGPYCQENVAIESRTPLYFAFMYYGTALFSLAFLIIFIQLLRAFYISARNKRCTAVPKTLCLVGLSASTLVGILNSLDPWSYRRTTTPIVKIFYAEFIFSSLILGTYPLWRTWFQLQGKFDRSRLLSLQSPLLLLTLVLYCLINLLTIILGSLRILSMVMIQWISNISTAVIIGYYMTVPTYFGWKIMQHLDQTKSKNELRSMTILVMGCTILFFILFCGLIVQVVLLPRVMAYSRTREILSFIVITSIVSVELLIAATIGRHSNEEIKRKRKVLPSPRANVERRPGSNTQRKSAPTPQLTPRQTPGKLVLPASATIVPDSADSERLLSLPTAIHHEVNQQGRDWSTVVHLPSASSCQDNEKDSNNDHNQNNKDAA